MTEYSGALAVGLAFTEAWTSHDLTTAPGYVAEDVVFDGPLAHLTGFDAYMEGLARFARAVTGLEIVAAFGDDDQSLIMYEVATRSFGTLRCAECFTVKDGKMQDSDGQVDVRHLRRPQGHSRGRVVTGGTAGPKRG